MAGNGKTVTEARGLENIVGGDGSGESGEFPVYPTMMREFVLYITDGKPEHQKAAAHLQENLGRMVGQSKQGLEFVVQQVPDVLSALTTFKENPLDVVLIVADKRGPETSGWRIKYAINQFDHLVWTGVIDAYTVRDVNTPKGTGHRVTEINPEELAKTLALEVKEMRGLFRKPVYRLSQAEREQIIKERRLAVDRILLDAGDYIIHGKGTQRGIGSADEFDPNMGVTAVMFPLRAGDLDTASARWQRLLKEKLSTTDLYGVTTFGLDQSIGGGYVLGDLTRMKPGTPVFGFKRAGSYEEALTFKAATDFQIALAEESSKMSESSRGKLRQMWRMAKLNVPRVVGVLPDEKGAVVFMEYKGLTIYPIGILNPSYPNILQGLIDQIGKGGDSSGIAAQVLDATFVTAAKKLGFWRANPNINAPAADLAERVKYYADREALFFRQASILGIELDNSQLAGIASFFDYLNSQLKLRPEDVALRLDMRVEHLGYETHDKLLPSVEDVIDATTLDGKVNLQEADDHLVFYDAGGKEISVPLHHELSHLKEHPLIRWNQLQAQRYTAIALTSQQMFEALKKRNGALKWYDLLNSLIAASPDSFDAQSIAQYIPDIANFGPNELIIDVYRDLEEARQILVMRLPRLYIRQDRQPPESERARVIEETIATRTEHLRYYAGRALQHLTAELPEYLPRPKEQQANYKLVCETIEKLSFTKEMPKSGLVKLWDGF